MKPASLITCLLLIAAIPALPQYYFEKLTVENGLSDNRVTCFFKDQQGFMWIGTADGLNRYDGHSFRIYRAGQKKFRLSGEYITGMAQDRRGRLWIATRTGLNVLNVEKDSLHIFTPDDDAYKQKSESLPSILVWDLQIDKQERVWLACDARDLCYYDPITGKFAYKPWKKMAENIFPQLRGRYLSINKIYKRGDTALWLGTTAGLFSYNLQSEQFGFYGGELSQDFIALAEHEDKVYFTQTRGTLQALDLKDLQLKKIPVNKAPRPVKSNALSSRNSIIWLPASGTVWEINNGIPSTLQHHAGNPFSAADADIKVVYTDNHHISWIGSNKGVALFDPRLNRFSFTAILPLAGSIQGNVINHIYYSETDDTYFGVSYKFNKAFSWNEREGYKELLRLEHAAPFMNFTAFYEDNAKRLWLLTRGGIYQYDRAKKKFRFFANPARKPGVLYTAMCQDAQGDLWLGSYPEGLYHYHAGSAHWSPADTAGGFETRIVSSVYFAKNTNQLWVGGYDYGLWMWDMKIKTWKYYGMNLQNPKRMNSSLVTDVNRDATGNIWAATNAGGLSRFDGTGQSEDCINYKMEDGLPENTILSLACDAKGNTWFATYKGLTCINSSGRILRHFDNRNGLPYENYSARLQVTGDGCIITAVRNGFIRFHPDSMSYPIGPYEVAITSCRVKDSSLENFHSLPNTRYSYKMNEWQFDFAALNYTNPAAIRYFYKLDGYDDHWVDAGNTHSARYTNLDHGRYTFRVKALHPSGTYSANEAAFSFSISPPFWKTWWFVALAATMVSAIVYFIYRYRLNKKRELERLRLRISRDLHDDIGSALTSINVLSKVALSKGGADMEIGGYLSQIKTAASDTMESMSDIVWAINPENDKLEAMISRMKEFAAEICEARQVDLDFVLPIEIERISFDAGKRKNIFLIFKEAVNNAIKYSEGPKLHISLERQGNLLKMEIRDNGKGFQVNHARTGNGLKNMKERAGAIGGSMKLHSGPGQGTAVQVQIPIS
jgi:ligand-binding sensor domain-containing protein